MILIDIINLNKQFKVFCQTLPKKFGNQRLLSKIEDHVEQCHGDL